MRGDSDASNRLIEGSPSLRACAGLWIGIGIVILGAEAMMAFCTSTFAGHPEAGNFTDTGGVAAGLGKCVSRTAGVLFAVALIDASIIGAVGC